MFVAPASTIVEWVHGSLPADVPRSYKINLGISWNGENQGEGLKQYLGRYGGGNMDLLTKGGAHIKYIGVENELQWYDILRQVWGYYPSRQEVYDYVIVNKAKVPLGGDAEELPKTPAPKNVRVEKEGEQDKLRWDWDGTGLPMFTVWTIHSDGPRFLWTGRPKEILVWDDDLEGKAHGFIVTARVRKMKDSDGAFLPVLPPTQNPPVVEPEPTPLTLEQKVEQLILRVSAIEAKLAT